MYNHVIVCMFTGLNPCQPVWYVQPRDCLSVYRTEPMPACLVCTTTWLSVCLQDRTHASLSGMYNHVIVCLFTGPNPCQPVWYVQPRDCLYVYRTEPMPACLVCTTMWLSVCLQDRTHASLSGMYNHVIVCLFTGPNPCQSVWYVQPCDCLSVCRTEPMPACLVCTTTWLSVCL